MKTKNTKFKQKLKVWAIPNAYHDPNDKNSAAFSYEVSSGVRWETGAIMVHEEEFEITVPAGIDLTAMAIETLKSAKEKLMAEYYKSRSEIDEQISNLLALEFRPTVVDEHEVIVEAEFKEDIDDEIRVSEEVNFDDDIPF